MGSVPTGHECASTKPNKYGFADIRVGFRELRSYPEGTGPNLHLRLPTQHVQRAIVENILGFSQTPELDDLVPVLNQNHFNQPEVGVLDFKIVGFPLIGYVLAKK